MKRSGVSILNSYDIIYEILKYVPLNQLYKYKNITRYINHIINNIFFIKNKKYIYYMKNFVKPRLFNMAHSFNNTYTYYYGLFMRLEPIILFIKDNNLDKEIPETTTINERLISIKFTLLKYILEHDISFKLMDITFDNINEKANNLQVNLNNLT